jgi:hypothetical protein
MLRPPLLLLLLLLPLPSSRRAQLRRVLVVVVASSRTRRRAHVVAHTSLLLSCRVRCIVAIAQSCVRGSSSMDQLLDFIIIRTSSYYSGNDLLRAPRAERIAGRDPYYNCRYPNYMYYEDTNTGL